MTSSFRCNVLQMGSYQQKCLLNQSVGHQPSLGLFPAAQTRPSPGNVYFAEAHKSAHVDNDRLTQYTAAITRYMALGSHYKFLQLIDDPDTCKWGLNTSKLETEREEVGPHCTHKRTTWTCTIRGSPQPVQLLVCPAIPPLISSRINKW